MKFLNRLAHREFLTLVAVAASALTLHIRERVIDMHAQPRRHLTWNMDRSAKRPPRAPARRAFCLPLAACVRTGGRIGRTRRGCDAFGANASAQTPAGSGNAVQLALNGICVYGVRSGCKRSAGLLTFRCDACRPPHLSDRSTRAGRSATVGRASALRVDRTRSPGDRDSEHSAPSPTG